MYVSLIFRINMEDTTDRQIDTLINNAGVNSPWRVTAKDHNNGRRCRSQFQIKKIC